MLLPLFLLFLFAPLLSQTVVQVPAGTDGLAAAIASAAPGDIIELTANGGLYTETAKLVINKPLTIRAASSLTQKPLLVSDAADAMIEFSAHFTLDGIILDGAQGAAPTAVGIINTPNTAGYNLTVLNSDFVNMDNADHSKGFGIFGVPSSVVDTVLIQNCFFAHILDMGISYNDPLTATGSVNVFKAENCTFWDMNSEAIYIDAFDSKMETKDPEVTFNKLTVYDCGSYNLIAHYIDYSVLTNSLVVLPELNTSYAPTKMYGTHSKIENFLYFNTRDIDLSYGATDFQLVNVVPQENPGLVDPENGNFSYPADSPAVLVGEDGTTIYLGDERWLVKPAAEKVYLAAGENVLATALAAAVDGQTLILTSSGGLYHESAKLIVDKKVTIMAADDLVQKPVISSDAADAMIQVSAGLTLQGVVLDGAQGADSTAVGITNAANTTGYNLTVRDTDFLNFSDKGQTTGFGIFGVPSSVVDTVLVQNCFFAHILDMGISFNDPLTATGSVNVFKAENCTFWDMNSEAIYIDAYDSKMETKDPEVTFNKLTVYDCGSYNLIAHYIDYSVLTNSLVVLPELNTSYAPTKMYGTHSKIENFLYFNTRDIDLSYGATDFQLVNVVPQENPGLVDPENGNFYYPADSPAVLVGEDGTMIYLGDERWGVKTATDIVYLEAGENILSAALAAAVDGQTLILTSSGGVYHESAKLIVDKKVTIMAADDLVQKPVISSGATDAMIEVSAGLTLKGLVLDGALGGVPTTTGITIKPQTSGYNLAVLESDLLNFGNASGSTGFGIFGDPSAVVDSCLVQNCYFAHIVKMGISFKSPLTATGSVNVFKADNCTFWDINAEAIYIDANDSKMETKDPEVTFNKLTVYDCGSYNLIAHYIDYSVLTNSIVVLPELNTGYAPTKMYGTHSKIENFVYLNTRDIDLSYGATDFQLINVLPQGDPGFADAANGNFHYALDSPAILVGDDGAPIYLGDDRWWPVTTGVNCAEVKNLPTLFSLAQNMPNPFNPVTTIQFTLPAAQRTSLKVYNMLGEEVAILAEGMLAAGPHSIKWNAADRPSGIYLYRLITESGTATRRMMLLK